MIYFRCGPSSKDLADYLPRRFRCANEVLDPNTGKPVHPIAVGGSIYPGGLSPTQVANRVGYLEQVTFEAKNDKV